MGNLISYEQPPQNSIEYLDDASCPLIRVVLSDTPYMFAAAVCELELITDSSQIPNLVEDTIQVRTERGVYSYPVTYIPHGIALDVLRGEFFAAMQQFRRQFAAVKMQCINQHLKKMNNALQYNTMQRVIPEPSKKAIHPTVVIHPNVSYPAESFPDASMSFYEMKPAGSDAIGALPQDCTSVLYTLHVASSIYKTMELIYNKCACSTLLISCIDHLITKLEHKYGPLSLVYPTTLHCKDKKIYDATVQAVSGFVVSIASGHRVRRN